MIQKGRLSVEFHFYNMLIKIKSEKNMFQKTEFSD